MGNFEVEKMLMSLLEFFIDSASLITCIILDNAQMVGDSRDLVHVVERWLLSHLTQLVV